MGLSLPNRGFRLLAEKTASNSANIDFTTEVDWTYPEILIVGNRIRPATDGVDLSLTLSVDGGATFISAINSYAVARRVLGANTNDYSAASAGTTLIGHAGAGNGISNASANGINIEDWFFSPSVAASVKQVAQRATYAGTVAYAIVEGAAFAINAALQASGVNGVRYAMSAGNISAGTFKVYGRR